MRASGWERTHIIAQVAVSQSLHIRDKFTQVLPPPASSPLLPVLFPPLSVVTGKSQKPASNQSPSVLHLTNSAVCNDVGERINGVELTPVGEMGSRYSQPQGASNYWVGAVMV